MPHTLSLPSPALSILFCALAAVQCTSNSLTVELGEEFDLQVGHSVILTNEGTTISFKLVEDDSRCPTGAVCVWEGNGRILLSVSDSNIALNTNLDPRKAAYSSFTIALVRLNPIPQVGRQIDPKDYVATLVVTKN